MDIFDPRQRRESAGYTQQECSELWGVPQSTLSRWENNPGMMKKYQRDLYLTLLPVGDCKEADEAHHPEQLGMAS